jgi:hypothetical protein
VIQIAGVMYPVFLFTTSTAQSYNIFVIPVQLMMTFWYSQGLAGLWLGKLAVVAMLAASTIFFI